MKTLKTSFLLQSSFLMLLVSPVAMAQWTENGNGIYYNEANRRVGVGSLPSLSDKFSIFVNSGDTSTTSLRLLNNSATLKDKFGLRNFLNFGQGVNTGIYNSVSNAESSAKDQRGIYNYLNPKEGVGYGIYNLVSKTSARAYGYYSYIHDNLTSTSSTGNHSYLYLNNTSGGSKYGVYSYITGTPEGTGNRYGVYSYVGNTGTSTRYGVYTRVNTSQEGTKYGVYAHAPGNTNYAGFFVGRGYFSESLRIGVAPTGDRTLDVYGNARIIGDLNIKNLKTDTVYVTKRLGIGTTDYGNNALKVNGHTKIIGDLEVTGTLSADVEAGLPDTLLVSSVGIGTSDVGSYALAISGKVGIEGKLEAKEIEVVNVDLPDYVFEDDYELRSLEEVENFIHKHQHLPEVPSALEVKNEGMNVTDMSNVLLRKIEELTLYVIEQNKKITKVQQENKLLREYISNSGSK